MEAREFTDGELEFVIDSLTGAILTLEGRPRARQNSRRVSPPDEFDFSSYTPESPTLLGFRDEDPRIDEQLTYARNVLDRLLSERDRRRAVTVQRICEWAEYGLPRVSQ
ncbi:hypothetical protein O9X90_08540 [Agrobacterium leguminum]|uniref:hypothetical protein n=1 Tax=Agrobacterium TaxID=357 RepID=UPI001A8EBDC4|nr:MULTISPECIES: hypothetical protein [Agrobacterium]MBO0127133.1 hypothetical protein [Agrobacterium sp. OT33]MCZ7932356.1 hypothetical protein [Agrobacterium leguminum]